MKWLLIPILMCGACGGTYKVEFPEDPIEVVHTFNLDDFKKAFYAICEEDHPTWSEYHLDKCANEKLGKFLNALGGV